MDSGPFVIVALLASTSAIAAAPQRQVQPAEVTSSTDAAVEVGCRDAGDLRLTNGRIHTMDGTDTMVSTVNIRSGIFVGVGKAGDQRPTPCTRTIDLRGRTAIPGLIDNHVHFIAMGRRPGHDLSLESAKSIAEIQLLIRDRAIGVSDDQFITAIGGWAPDQLNERRMPNLVELDAAAVGFPVLVVSNTGTFGSANSAAKNFLEQHGVAITTEGQIESSAHVLRAVALLKNAMADEQIKSNTLEQMTRASALGLTTVMDMGSGVYTGTAVDSIGAWDHATGYDTILALANDRKLKLRLRLNYLTYDTTPELPILRNRLSYSHRQFGSDMLRSACIGETIWTFAGEGGINSGTLAPTYTAAARLVAEHGDCYEQHSVKPEATAAITDVWEKLNGDFALAPLHWRIAHGFGIDALALKRLEALGVGLSVIGSTKMPYRTIVDSGVHTGAGSDGRNSLPFNPWLNIEYMVTGRNAAGILDNAGETISRKQALRLYTANNGWFSKEEDKLGSIEIGKYADIVVLNRDYFNQQAVPDEEIDAISSLTTIVGGLVMHSDW